jgi:hypothetical protein
MHLEVAVHRLLADAAGRFAFGVQALGQLSDRLLQARRDRGEVVLVPRDQRGVGLGREVVR